MAESQSVGHSPGVYPRAHRSQILVLDFPNEIVLRYSTRALVLRFGVSRYYYWLGVRCIVCEGSVRAWGVACFRKISFKV